MGLRGPWTPQNFRFGTSRDLILEKGDFVILVTLLWPPLGMKILTEPLICGSRFFISGLWMGQNTVLVKMQIAKIYLLIFYPITIAVEFYFLGSQFLSKDRK